MTGEQTLDAKLFCQTTSAPRSDPSGLADIDFEAWKKSWEVSEWHRPTVAKRNAGNRKGEFLQLAITAYDTERFAEKGTVDKIMTDVAKWYHKYAIYSTCYFLARQ